MTKRSLVMILFSFFIGVSSVQAEQRTIVCTTGMIRDIVNTLAGERATVIGLMGSGVDPHLYKPTRSDIAKLSSADIVFYNGLLLEGKMTDALIRVATAGKKVFAVTDLLDKDYLLEPPEFAGHYDPHVWMDPRAWAHAVDVVSQTLQEIDPEHAEYYAKNTERYQAQLAALDSYAVNAISSIPEHARVLVTAHDAFNYFGRRFRMEVLGIQGLSTESEAGVKDIERLVELIVDRKIPAVFIESTVSDRNINALIQGAAARKHQVIVGGELFSDAMGPEGSYEGSYIGMIDHNVTTIARALGGSVPERGMRGKLSRSAHND